MLRVTTSLQTVRHCCIIQRQAELQFVHQVGFSLEPCTMLTVPVDFLSTTVPGFDVDPGYYCMGNLLVLGPKRGGGAGAKALQRRTSPCWGGARGCANLLHCFSRVCSRMDADISHVLGGRQTVQNVLPYHTCPNSPPSPLPGTYHPVFQPFCANF